MTGFASCYTNQSARATAGFFAAAVSSCARFLTMDAASCAASFFVTLILVGLLGLAGLGVSILAVVCAVIVRGLIIMGSTPRLEKANPVF